MRYLNLLLILFIILVSCSTESTQLYKVTTSVEPSEAGSVSPSSIEVNQGNNIEVKATANEQWIFDRWTGDFSGSSNPADIKVDSDLSITAVFVKKPYPLEVDVIGNGKVEQSLVSSKSIDYPSGSIVELKALQLSHDWKFVRWEGSINSSDNPTDIIIDSPKSVTAIFEQSSKIFTEGDGSINNPYLIETIGQLQALRDYPESHFILNQNIDASFSSVWDDSTGFVPIGDKIIPFSGSLNGNNYTISNLTINSQGGGGLFGVTDNATIKNIHLENIEISSFGAMGGLIGRAYNTIIDNVSVTGDVITKSHSGYHYGGLIGHSISSNITDAHFKGYIFGMDETGGLIGGLERSSVENSYAEANVVGRRVVGGLVGGSFQSEIDNSYSISNVSGKEFIDEDDYLYTSVIGGFIGTNSGKIYNSYSNGNVVGGDTIGGFAGSNSGIISNSFSMNEVTGNDNIGGFAGVNRDELTFSYSKSNIEGNDNLGGISGINHGTISNVYSRSDIYGSSSIGGISGIHSGDVIELAYSVGSVNGSNETGALIGTNGGDIYSLFWDSTVSDISSAVGRGSDDSTMGLKTNKMQGAAAQDNMPEFDWGNIWITTDGYPILRWQKE